MTTHEMLCAAWIAIAVLGFPFLLRIRAPYGRHTRKGWGPEMDNRLAWVVMELPTLLIVPLMFWLGAGPKGSVALLLVVLWTLHYINRTLIFPLRTHTRGKRMPVLIAASAIGFNLVNAGLNGWQLGWLADQPAAWMRSPVFIAGAALFVAGFVINNRADNALIALRKPGETGYKIPQGGLFRYISCPNHFGEIVEWTGFALMSGSLAGWSFAIWTAANLIPRALHHHQWYRQQFPDYPAERKAVIPGLW